VQLPASDGSSLQRPFSLRSIPQRASYADARRHSVRLYSAPCTQVRDTCLETEAAPAHSQALLQSILAVEHVAALRLMLLLLLVQRATLRPSGAPC
jgi:hypothetical protein